MIKKQAKLSIRATEISRQKMVEVSGLPPERTIGEFVQQIVEVLDLPRQGRDGLPIVYQAFFERDREPLDLTDRIGDKAQEDDLLVVHPPISCC